MNTIQVIEEHLHNIIDENHPLFKPISDEMLIEKNSSYAHFSRDFKHKNGKLFRMTWKVYDYFSPKTVKTVFEPAIEI